MAEGFYIGTDLKFKIDIKAEGFDMEFDDFSIMLKCGNDTLDLPDECIVSDGDGGYYILVDTSVFTSGPLQMIVTAYVPDDDFPTGIRHEVVKVDLCRIKNV